MRRKEDFKNRFKYPRITSFTLSSYIQQEYRSNYPAILQSKAVLPPRLSASRQSLHLPGPSRTTNLHLFIPTPAFRKSPLREPGNRVIFHTFPYSRPRRLFQYERKNASKGVGKRKEKTKKKRQTEAASRSIRITSDTFAWRHSGGGCIAIRVTHAPLNPLTTRARALRMREPGIRPPILRSRCCGTIVCPARSSRTRERVRTASAQRCFALAHHPLVSLFIHPRLPRLFQPVHPATHQSPIHPSAHAAQVPMEGTMHPASTLRASESGYCRIRWVRQSAVSPLAGSAGCGHITITATISFPFFSFLYFPPCSSFAIRCLVCYHASSSRSLFIYISHQLVYPSLLRVHATRCSDNNGYYSLCRTVTRYRARAAPSLFPLADFASRQQEVGIRGARTAPSSTKQAHRRPITMASLPKRFIVIGRVRHSAHASMRTNHCFAGMGGPLCTATPSTLATSMLCRRRGAAS